MTLQPSLFDAADRARDFERLIPLAQELASKAGRHGVTVSDLRLFAEARGLITNHESGRRLSYLGKVMQAAGLVATKEWRRSSIPRSHGNAQVVWVAAEYAEQAA